MITIRKATPKDALGISIVNVYTWKPTYSGLIPEEFIDSRIEKVIEIAERNKREIEENKNFIVATVDDIIVGFASYGESREEQFINAGEIYAIYVLSGFQGKDIGKKIFTSCIDELKKNRFDSVILNCLKGNKSLEFYKHMGAKIIGEREDKVKGILMMADILLLEI